MAPKLTLRLDGVETAAEVHAAADGTRVRLGDRWFTVELEPTGRPDLYSLLIDGRSFEVFARRRAGGWDILIGNRVFSVDTGAARAGRAAAPVPEGVWVLHSPLAGIVVEVRVAPGEEVRAGQVLLVVESMKMNNELTAARAGRVTRVAVRPGDRVERGAPLIQIE